MHLTFLSFIQNLSEGRFWCFGEYLKIEKKENESIGKQKVFELKKREA